MTEERERQDATLIAALDQDGEDAVKLKLLGHSYSTHDRIVVVRWLEAKDRERSGQKRAGQEGLAKEARAKGVRNLIAVAVVVLAAAATVIGAMLYYLGWIPH
jgi:hypothetical protein